MDNLIDFWVNSLPITKDKEESKINNKFLLDVLMKEPNKVLGPSNKNLGQIIVILAKGYNTDSTDKEMDKNIESFAEGIIKNEEYKIILKIKAFLFYIIGDYAIKIILLGNIY